MHFVLVNKSLRFVHVIKLRRDINNTPLGIDKSESCIIIIVCNKRNLMIIMLSFSQSIICLVLFSLHLRQFHSTQVFTFLETLNFLIQK